MKGCSIMGKLEEILAETRLKEILTKNGERDCKKMLLWTLAIIGAIAAVAVIAYLVYRHTAPDYLEDLDEDFDGAFEDYFAEEDE
jgi:predicted nucleic acid-binding Zn ribbon protein